MAARTEGRRGAFTFTFTRGDANETGREPPCTTFQHAVHDRRATSSRFSGVFFSPYLVIQQACKLVALRQGGAEVESVALGKASLLPRLGKVDYELGAPKFVKGDRVHVHERHNTM